MAVTLKCPVCRKKFSWQFGEESRWPRECPFPECRAEMGVDDDDTVICMPSLRSAKTTANDALYRQMEKGSEIRAEAAAAQLGVSVSEMSALKITNLKDNVKPGETYAPSVAAQQANLESGGSKVGFQVNGAEYASMVKAGPYPNAGAKTLQALKQSTGRG